jgi:hypothetical protein
MPTKHLPLVFTISILCAIGGAQASDIGPHRSKPSSDTYPWNTWIASGMFNTPSSPDNWLGGTGNWSNSADWSAGLPGSNSDVTINTGSDNVTLDTSSSINSLVLGGATGLSQLTDDGNPHTLTIAGALTVNQSGQLSLLSGSSATTGASSANLGNIDLEFGSSLQANGDLNNSGYLYGARINESSANVTVTGTLTNSGSINLGFFFESMQEGSGTLTAGTLVNTGSIGLIASHAGAGSLVNEGNISLASDFTSLNVNGDVTNSGGIDAGGPKTQASISIGGRLTNTATGVLNLGGAVNGSSQASVGFVTNAGTISVGTYGYLSVYSDVTNSGGIGTGNMGGSIRIGGDVTNSGGIGAGPYGIINIGGRLTNTATGSLYVAGALNAPSQTSVGFVTNAGIVSVGTYGYLVVTGGAHAAPNALPGFLNTGIVNISTGGALTSPLTYTQTSGQTTVDGMLGVSGLGSINFAGGSVYGNGGTIQGNAISNAAINIGDSPMAIGQLFMVGNYTQGANGSLTFDIAGTAARQYDHLNVSGKAKFNGLMTVNLLNGFVPQIGNMFDIMNFASGSGTFSQVLGLPINNQEHFLLEYNPTNLTLDVVQGPDTNIGDEGSSIRASSITWVSNNGAFQGASNNGTSAPTPEPSSILLVGSGLVGIATVLRRKGRI